MRFNYFRFYNLVKKIRILLQRFTNGLSAIKKLKFYFKYIIQLLITKTFIMSEKKVNTIDLVHAKHYAAKWRKEEGTYNAHHRLKAFVIPKEDLLEVLAQGVDAVRAYVGVDDNDEEKLMIVGTKQVGDEYIDMLPETGFEDGSIYDFTRPCPPSCDKNSPLN